MNYKLPSVTISGLALSDLFFNHENENYAAACRDCGSETSNEDYKSATHEGIFTDATKFVELLAQEINTIEATKLAQDLAEDFLARL